MYIYDCLRHFVTLEEDEDDEEGDESKMTFFCKQVSVLQELASVFKNYSSYLSAKIYVVGTQQNRIYETVLLSSQNTCLNRRLRE